MQSAEEEQRSLGCGIEYSAPCGFTRSPVAGKSYSGKDLRESRSRFRAWYVLMVSLNYVLQGSKLDRRRMRIALRPGNVRMN